MQDELIRVEIADGIARCILNGPTNRNAVSRELVLAMADKITPLVSDNKIRVIVVRGEGGHFCGGADLKQLGEHHDPVRLNSAMKVANTVIRALKEAPKPVIAEVDGYAVGGGFSLALTADIVYATERAVFSMAWIRVAGVPDFGFAYLLAERLGLGRAKEYAFTGEMIRAEEAFRLGIVDRIVPHETISEVVLELAHRLAQQSAAALAGTKRAMNAARRLDLATTLDLEAHVQPLMFLSSSHREAVAKFFAK